MNSASGFWKNIFEIMEVVDFAEGNRLFVEKYTEAAIEELEKVVTVRDWEEAAIDAAIAQLEARLGARSPEARNLVIDAEGRVTCVS